MQLYYYFFYELKNRVLLISVTGLSSTMISYYYKEVLIYLICLNSDFFFIYTNMTEVFSIYVNLIVFLNTQILFIYFVFHFLVFLGPGLYINEYYYLKHLFNISLTFFCFSIFFFNSFLFPFSCNFFLGFEHTTLKTLSFYFEAKIIDYFKFYIVLYYTCCLHFQIFAFLFFIFLFFDQNKKEIKLLRKLFYFLFYVFSAVVVIFFNDILGQFLFFFGLIIFYEMLLIQFLLLKNLKTFYEGKC